MAAQTGFLLSYIDVISSICVNKFAQKCQYYYTLSDQSVSLVTIRSLFYILRIPVWLHYQWININVAETKQPIGLEYSIVKDSNVDMTVGN